MQHSRAAVSQAMFLFMSMLMIVVDTTDHLVDFFGKKKCLCAIGMEHGAHLKLKTLFVSIMASAQSF